MDGIIAPSIQIVRDRLVYANQYGALYDDDVEFKPAGNRGRYVRWRWAASYSVAVLALEGPGTALLVHNFRHSARREVLEAVKGFGRDGVEPSEMARTELSEELGFIADEMILLGTTHSDPAFADHPMECFLATGRISRAAAPETTEAIAGYRRFTLADTPSALASGTVQDSVTLLLLWQALHRSAST